MNKIIWILRYQKGALTSQVCEHQALGQIAFSHKTPYQQNHQQKIATEKYLATRWKIYVGDKKWNCAQSLIKKSFLKLVQSKYVLMGQVFWRCFKNLKCQLARKMWLRETTLTNARLIHQLQNDLSNLQIERNRNAWLFNRHVLKACSSINVRPRTWNEKKNTENIFRVSNQFLRSAVALFILECWKWTR